jgi:hypothetical protein
MRMASGNELFFLEHAEKSRKAYIDYLNTVNPVQAQVNLEQIVASESPDNQQSLKRLSSVN